MKAKYLDYGLRSELTSVQAGSELLTGEVYDFCVGGEMLPKEIIMSETGC